MPAAHTITVDSLAPDQYGIDIAVKVVNAIVSVELNDGAKTVRVYEHLVGDATGCIILKSQQDLAGVIRITGGYTQVVDGYLRLVAAEGDKSIESIPDNSVSVLTQNNLSLTKLVRRV
ncbi:hypothetical protein BDB00DRAFT_838566 [Zychaea mexicana]|uniref:uncharacterized protein n=1 Tax=Zychaea mexicana TaxID=64656 RepID=UPI0022FEB6EE|nr:uncharacterized protein BDB00DRAFT_838566 [Zychaea mexicana]KAI9490297.1 hypothetical protein BDB00DRAFT_838566 [Zychaea mexicana]